MGKESADYNGGVVHGIVAEHWNAVCKRLCWTRNFDDHISLKEKWKGVLKRLK